MSGELVSIAAFGTFSEAAAAASRELAIKLQRQTGIQRVANKWAVMLALISWPSSVRLLRANIAATIRISMTSPTHLTTTTPSS